MHAGNGMGYIRMVRSGGLNICSNAIRFLPDLQSVASFADTLEGEGVSDATLQAARYAYIHIQKDMKERQRA